MTLTLDQATAIAAATLAEGARRGLAPLTVAVLDAGGILIVLQRQDRASSLRPEIAVGKAAGALGMGMSSRKLAAIAQERPSFFAALTALAPRGMVPAAGGVLVVDASGAVLGAVGVTGDTSDADEACALAGVAAAGLQVQP